jgi:multicomponent Na+:H+ antiporter subunit F
MERIFVLIAAILIAIILIPLYRVIKGPTIFDRLLGAGAIGTKTLVIISLIGFIFGRVDMFIDITLAYAILNFIGSITIARYFETPKVRE